MIRATPILLAALALVPPAAAQGGGGACTTDQSQEELDYGYLLTVSNPRWQEFVPTRAVVCGVEFNAYREGDPGDFLIELLDAADDVIAAAVLPEAETLTGWIPVAMPVTPVVPGASYKLRILPLQQHDAVNRLTWYGKRDSSYTQGITSVESTLPDYDFRFRTKGRGEVGAPFCFGDGGGTACPCGNETQGPGGCGNSSGAGAELRAVGSASAAVDDLELIAAHLLPGQPALLLAGTTAVGGGQGLPFGDGLRCTGQGVARLGVGLPGAGGLASWGPGLRAAGGWNPGETRQFQAWYRDPAGPCGSGFNLSNAVELGFL